MKKSIFVLTFFCFTSIVIAQTKEDVKKIVSQYDVKKITALQNELQIKAIKDKEVALRQAKINGWPVVINNPDGSLQELMKVGLDGKPIYYATDNAAAAKSTRTNFLHSNGGLGLALNGQDMVARVWDGGRVRLTHNLFSNRVTTDDDNENPIFSSHATHVTGTIIASAAVANTKGMAYQATAKTYNWSSDESEVLGEVLNGMLISNHSYGIPLVNNNGVKQQAWLVGAYLQESKTWDEIAYLAPYYLMVTSAGNSGSQDNTEPSSAGHDKLIGNKLSKNVLSIANAKDATIDANGNLITVEISTSSSQGPSDDGRIKPDIAGNGSSVTSSGSTSDSSTATLSGTSMASPNVAGTLLLVQQHYKNINGNFMKAATLKGLATHTADDSGNFGPDATFGWGLLNGKKCVETITSNGLQSWVSEETLRQNQSYTMNVKSNGTAPLIASITWTDVPGQAYANPAIVNNPIPALVNDLDIRITKNGTTYYPWRLDSDANSDAIRTGDNNVDNVENITIDAPVAGDYTITITHKGTLVDGQQKFAMIVTGVNSNFAINEVSNEDITICASQNAIYNFNYKQIGTGTTNFSAINLPAGATASFNNGSLSANGVVTMTLSNLSNVAPGIYRVGIVGSNEIESEIRYKNLRIFNASFQPIQPTSPLNNINDASTIVSIKWNKDINAENYKIEIATDNNFATIISVINTADNFMITNALNQNTSYYFRIIPSNNCGVGTNTNAIVTKFTTGVLQCNNIFAATDFSNNSIENTADGLAIIPINVTGNMKIGDINVNLKITHTYVQDMTISLIGPDAIGNPEVFLTKETCGEFNNIDAVFDDAGNLVECSNVAPSIAGTITPFSPLSSLNGMLAEGIWKIKVMDPYDGDGGTVVSASLNFCKVTPSSLSSSEFTSSELAVYPNPTTGVLNIFLSNKNNEETNLDLVDIQGRKILMKSFKAESESIDISSYQKGVYFLTIKNGNQQKTQKIILNN